MIDQTNNRNIDRIAEQQIERMKDKQMENNRMTEHWQRETDTR